MDSTAVTPTAASHGQPVVVHDIAFDPPMGWRVIVYAALLGALCAGAAVAVIAVFGRVGWIGGAGGLIGGLIGALIMLPCLWILQRSATRAYARALQRIAQGASQGSGSTSGWETPVQALDEVGRKFGQFALASNFRKSIIRRTGELIVERGGGGKVVRLLSNRTARAELPPPLLVPFEPVPLRDIRGGFTDLRGGRITGRERAQQVWTDLRSMEQRGWVRWLIVSGFLLGSLILLIHFGVGLVNLSRGRVSPELIIGGLILLIGLVFGIAGVMKSDRWFLVPGGVIVLECGAWDRSWKARLLTAQSSALLSYHQRVVVIATRIPAAYSAFRTVTPWEFELLLRAWRSPLPPPTAEQVAGLTGG